MATHPAPTPPSSPHPKLQGKLAILRPPQRDAIAAFANNNQRGIVILPCGTGKTAVMLKCLCDSGARKALLITSSNPAALQLKNDILTGTTIDPRAVRMLTGPTKESLTGDHVVVITTYTLFGREELGWESMFYFDDLKKMQLDFVALDEVHSAPAAHFRKFVSLIIHSPYHDPPVCVLALTATLFREKQRSNSSHPQRIDDGDELSISDFGFIGDVVYRATWSAMQLLGVIAKIRFIQVNCTIDADVQSAIATTSNLNERNDLLALPPTKTEAAGTIARLHRSWGHQVLVFVERLLLLELLVDLDVFPGFEVVSGENTPENNAASFARLEAGEIPGLILSKLGDTAINLTSPSLQCLIKLDGPPRSRCRDIQRTGRVARTPDIGAFEGETDEAATARRRAAQKTAFVYSMVTEGEPETSGAAYREAALRSEGYLRSNEEGPDELKLIQISAAEVCREGKDYHFSLSESQRADLITKLATRQKEAKVERAVHGAVREQKNAIAKAQREKAERIAKIPSTLMKRRCQKQEKASQAKRRGTHEQFLKELAEKTREAVRNGR